MKRKSSRESRKRKKRGGIKSRVHEIWSETKKGIDKVFESFGGGGYKVESDKAVNVAESFESNQQWEKKIDIEESS